MTPILISLKFSHFSILKQLSRWFPVDVYGRIFYIEAENCSILSYLSTVSRQKSVDHSQTIYLY